MDKLELKPEREYNRIHAWLKREYGKADYCESARCNKKSNSYHWALKKGHEHIKERDAYIQLCPSCHKIYDMNNKTKEKMSLAKSGEKHPMAKLTKQKVNNIRLRYLFGNVKKLILAQQYGVCWHTIHYILIGRTWKN